MRILLGVTGTKNLSTMNAVRFLAEELNLCHINIKQPVADEMAEKLQISAHEVTNTLNQYEHIDVLECNANELEQALINKKTDANPYFFVDIAQEKIVTAKIFGKIFRGFIVSNITTESEAAWVRGCGATMLHIIDTRGLGTTERIRIDTADMMILTGSNAEPNHNTLKIVLDRFKKRAAA